MIALRDPHSGCEWDKAQTFSTIAPYTIEEAYEVADAIQREDTVSLKEELGDLLLQVVFHARIAEDQGLFDFDDVATGIADKMLTRHPHIFAEDGGSMDTRRWEDLKERERTSKGSRSAMDGVATAFPALLRAEKLQKRAARTGFDWPDTTGPKAKIGEELLELEEAAEANRSEEAGDLLFAAVNLVRHYGLSAEHALARANAKFERRFRAMEKLSDGKFADLDIDEQERLWSQVKEAEKSAV